MVLFFAIKGVKILESVFKSIHNFILEDLFHVFYQQHESTILLKEKK
jgi:hypothetical protein